MKTMLKKKKKSIGKSKEIGVPRDVMCDDTDFVPVLALDCRGIEPYEFHFLGNEIIAESEGGVRFDEVDLSEDWAEYDEENNMPVSITSIETKFVVV